MDFVCLRQRLIIEVDGGQHNFDEHAARDKARDTHFMHAGFKVLRFWNNDVDKNFDDVLEAIDEALRNGVPHPVGSADHPPPAGEG